MVKHQRRSHQRGIHSSELDDSMSDTGSEDSPSTPKSHSAMAWPQHHHVPMLGPHSHHLQRAASFADFGQHMQGYNLQQQYNHRHSLSSGGPAEYHGPLHSQAPHHHHEQQQPQQPHPQQHPGVQMLQRTSSLPHHSYFVPDQNNPGVATMNTNPHPHHAAPVHQYQQIPRQGVERLPLEIPSYPNASGLAASLQSSPSSFSAGSGRSPSTQDGFYTHAPPAQAATYALHSASPVVEQQGVVSFPPPPQAVAQPPTSQPQSDQYSHQQQHQQTSEPQWYDSVPYQPPVEVTTIGQIPTYGAGGVYDPWGGPKLEFEDPSMQMPSARIESM